MHQLKQHTYVKTQVTLFRKPAGHAWQHWVCEAAVGDAELLFARAPLGPVAVDALERAEALDAGQVAEDHEAE